MHAEQRAACFVCFNVSARKCIVNRSTKPKFLKVKKSGLAEAQGAHIGDSPLSAAQTEAPAGRAVYQVGWHRSAQGGKSPLLEVLPNSQPHEKGAV